MRYDKAQVGVACFDPFHEQLRIGLNVGLTALDSEARVHGRTQRDLVAHSDVNARN
jgi:hypothetical protein